MEVNPGTVDQERFSGYREVGVNRLSIGVQSFQDDKLKTLARIHNTTIAKHAHAVQSAKRTGFDSINIDLMFGGIEQIAILYQMSLKATQKYWEKSIY